MSEHNLRDKYHKSVIEEGVSPEVLQDIYSDWSKQYDEHMVNFNAPVIVAHAAANVLGDNKDAKILDAGAGTGPVGLQLQKLGFKNLDAMDANLGMLEEAKKQGIYKNIICDYLGPNQMNIDEGSYDIVTLSGVFATNHANESCFEELIRITKPGGYIVLTVSLQFLNTPGFNNFEPTLNTLVTQGKWKLLQREVRTDYWKPGDIQFDGVLFVLQKTE